MTKAPPFPSPIFIAWTHNGARGWNIEGDYCADLDDAMDNISEAHKSAADEPGYWFIEKLARDPDTGLAERPEDVTEQAKRERIDWLNANDISVPSWLSGEDDTWTLEDEMAARADAAWHEREDLE